MTLACRDPTLRDSMKSCIPSCVQQTPAMTPAEMYADGAMCVKKIRGFSLYDLSMYLL